MCGIFGMIRCNTARHPEQASHIFAELGHLSVERGKDAAGFALTTCDNDWVTQPTAEHSNTKHTIIDGVTIVKDTTTFTDLWDNATHLPMLNEARVALGHTRWATQGKADSLVNASPLLVGNLVGTHNGDVDTSSIPNHQYLGVANGATDTERLFQSLNQGPRRTDRRKSVETLTAVAGRAALAWIDRGRQDRVYLARTTLSPLAIAFDADNNLYWASNPDWFRQIEAKMGNTIGFHSILMVREGSLLTISTNGDTPYIEDTRNFTGTCRASDARLGDGIIWRGFHPDDIAIDKAQINRKVRPAPPASSKPGKYAWGQPWAAPTKLTSTAGIKITPGTARSLHDALAAEEPDVDVLDLNYGDDRADMDDEIDAAVMDWVEHGYDPAVVSRLKEAVTVVGSQQMMLDFGLTSLTALGYFREEVLSWHGEMG